MRSIDFEDFGYLTKERLCGPFRTRLFSSLTDGEDYSKEEAFGVSIPNKYHGLYFNYLIMHSIEEKDLFWKLDDFFGNAREDSWHMTVTFSPNEGKILEKLREPLCYYTTESVLKAFSSTPELATYLTAGISKYYYNNKEISPWYFSDKSSLWIFHENIGSIYSEKMEREDSETLFSLARLISSQLRVLSIDTSKLVKIKKTQETPLLPKWLENTLKIGAKVGIKYLCAAIGARIDFPDFGGDNSNNGPDLGSGDGGFDIGDDGYDWGSDDGYDFGSDDGLDFGGIAFQGKHFVGYEDMDKTISVPIMGGGGNGTLHIYKKHGSSTIYVSDGSCFPVSTAGRDWIKVGSHKFEVSKIKSLTNS